MPNRNVANPIGDKQPTPPEDTDSAIFGDIKAADRNAGERVKLTSIFEIYPDPMQPRRAIPSLVRQEWDGNLANINQVFTAWEELARAELRAMGGNSTFDFRGVALGNEDPASFVLPEFGAPLSVALRDLAGLAALVYRNGLVNPITIVREGDFYSIETGERRWLVYHLLYWLTRGNTNWGNIPARLMPGFDIWRQASENNARQNLNAVAKARQFALLMMELIGWDQFQSLAHFPDEQAFYAQVTQHRVPSGKGELVMSAMGFKSRQSVSRCQKLLRLPSHWWVKGDDENTPEDTLLKYVPIKNVTSRDNSQLERHAKPYNASDLNPYKFILEINEQSADWEPSLKQKAFESIEVIEKRLAQAKTLLGRNK